MGFTLIELIVTIAIVGILLAWAIPNFRTLIMNQRLATSANDFIADTSFARSEAVKRGGNVGICVSSDGTTCTGGAWEAGRIVFLDSNNDGAFAPGEPVLRSREPLPTPNTMRPAAALDPIIFNSRGVLAGGVPGGVNFALCDSRGTTYARTIVVSQIGQVRVDSNPPGSCP